MEHEALRRSFQPARVRLLFVGESPPASGRFFYSADSGLYRAMLAAFERADPKVNNDNFLPAFRSYGCYLTDLSREPIDHMEPAVRRVKRLAGEGPLAREIARLQPAMIATLLHSITPNVERAAARAKWHGSLLRLPYPGRWIRHRAVFLEALVPVIQRLREEGI